MKSDSSSSSPFNPPAPPAADAASSPPSSPVDADTSTPSDFVSAAPAFDPIGRVGILDRRYLRPLLLSKVVGCGVSTPDSSDRLAALATVVRELMAAGEPSGWCAG